MDDNFVLKYKELDDDICVRLILYKEYLYIDIRKYINNFFTKDGIRLRKSVFDKISNIDFKKVEEKIKEKNDRVFYAGKKEINIEKSIKIRVSCDVVVELMSIEGKEYVDIRNYFNGFPTSNGIRLNMSTFKKIINIDFD